MADEDLMMINIGVLSIFILFLSACATSGSGKTLVEKRSGSDVWVKYYIKEANEWRQDGIEPMAQYFDIRAIEDREKSVKADAGFLGLFFN
ncbi:MAG: hypothetical protein OEM38_06110 [Gammaproteobacteria bacterium]|nr:hypothetical protein [Gammaproteobacteria bacterium]